MYICVYSLRIEFIYKQPNSTTKFSEVPLWWWFYSSWI